MTRTRLRRMLPALAAAAVLALLAGCGSDSSGETSTDAAAATSISIASPTSPNAPTSTAPATTTTGGGKQKTTQSTSTTSGGGSASCDIPVAFEDFKFTGLDCTAAVAVAQAWDQNGKTCNTVDNPESPIGPQRTCNVNGYSCTAKRDRYSDARFVTCAQGGQSVRFTWLPA